MRCACVCSYVHAHDVHMYDLCVGVSMVCVGVEVGGLYTTWVCVGVCLVWGGVHGCGCCVDMWFWVCM